MDRTLKAIFPKEHINITINTNGTNATPTAASTSWPITSPLYGNSWEKKNPKFTRQLREFSATVREKNKNATLIDDELWATESRFSSIFKKEHEDVSRNQKLGKAPVDDLKEQRHFQKLQYLLMILLPYPFLNLGLNVDDLNNSTMFS